MRVPFSDPETTRGLDLLVSYANDRTQSNQESRDHGSNEIGWLRRSNVQDINGIQYQQEGVRIQSMYGSFAHLSPLPAIRVLYVSGVKGPIKVLCMQVCRMKSSPDQCISFPTLKSARFSQPGIKVIYPGFP